MTDQAVASILSGVGLKTTATRKRILQVFQDNDYALNYNELQDFLGKSFDKVTVYRNLKTFEDAGILHQVPDLGGGVRYALCSSSCNKDHHQDSHVHFKCNSCEKTYCIEQTQIPHLALPKGYLMNEVSVLATGICKDCYQKK